MQQPRREQDQPAGLGMNGLVDPARLAAGHREAQMGGVHIRRRATRIEEFQLAAERRIGTDAPVIDIVYARPVGAGMRMGLVGVAAAIDVRPHVGAPGHREIAGMRAGADITRAIRRHAIGDVASDCEQLDGRRPAPPIHVVGRLPAALIGAFAAVIRPLTFQDHPPQVGVERRRVGHVEQHQWRCKKRDDFEGFTGHVPILCQAQRSIATRLPAALSDDVDEQGRQIGARHRQAFRRLPRQHGAIVFVVENELEQALLDRP